MTPEEQAKIDAVTAKLTGERFVAKQRPIPPFDWYVWDNKRQTVTVQCASQRDAALHAASYNTQHN